MKDREIRANEYNISERPMFESLSGFGGKRKKERKKRISELCSECEAC